MPLLFFMRPKTARPSTAFLKTFVLNVFLFAYKRKKKEKKNLFYFFIFCKDVGVYTLQSYWFTHHVYCVCIYVLMIPML